MRISRGRFFLMYGAAIFLMASPLVSPTSTPAAFADNPPAPQPTGANPQSLADGCQRDPAALIAQSTPEWVYVYDSQTSQLGNSPPPQWVSGVIDSYNRRFAPVHTSGADFAFGHDTYDFNVNLIPDPEYTFLIAGHRATSTGSATGNYAGDGEETARLHTEWEDLTVPKFAWPEPGDRLTEKGSWVWDCGHWGTPTNVFSPDYDIPHLGQPCPLGFAPDPSQCTPTGEHTEFHPYRAMFVQRQQQPDTGFPVEPGTNHNSLGVNPYSSLGDNPNSPSGDNEGDLFVSTEQTRAGVVADCAHRFRPPTQTVAYPADFTACVNAGQPNWQDVTGHYSFFLPAPAKPTPDAQLTFHAENQPQTTDESATTAPAPAPTLTAEGNGVRITFDITCGELDVNCTLKKRLAMAYKVFVGWDTVLPSQVPTHLRVTFDKVDIHRAMDPGCSLGNPVPGCADESTRTNQGTAAPGDWNLYWDANGIWGQWPCTGTVCRPDAPGEFLANDSDSFNGTQSVDLYVPPGKGWRLFVHGRECDLNAVDPARPMRDCPTNQELADDNDVPGLILDTYGSADASVGTHVSNGRTRSADPTSTCPNTNPQGCYSLTYTVTKVNDAASRARIPDLTLSKSDSPDPVNAGDPLTYALTVTNAGPATAGGISVTDNLPSTVTFTSASASQGTCSQANGVVTCAIGTLRPGAQATITIVVRPQEAGTITNSASVQSANEPDANPADNSASASTQVINPKADLSVTKTDAPDPAHVGQQLTYTLSVRNNGPSTASGVTVGDQLPKTTGFGSVRSTQGTCSRNKSTNTITCSIGTLRGGATATVTIVVKPTQKGSIPNTATVNRTSPPDPNSANNSSTASTRVLP